jgi:hypothetical protein
MGATLNFHLFAVTYVSLPIQSVIGHTRICTDLQGVPRRISSWLHRTFLVHDSAGEAAQKSEWICGPSRRTRCRRRNIRFRWGPSQKPNLVGYCMAARVFFSYSHKDEALRDQLEVHLAILKHQGLIDAWHDRRLLAGDGLDEGIEQHLNSAHIILLLISPDFLASDYCYKIEKTRALERHLNKQSRLISVILRPCDWKSTILARYLVAPKDGKPITSWPSSDEAFLDVTQAIRRAISSLNLQQPFSEMKTAEAQGSEPLPPRSSNLRI